MMYQFLTLDDGKDLSDYIEAILKRDEAEPARTCLDVEHIEKLKLSRNSSRGDVLQLKSRFIAMLNRWDEAPYSHTLKEVTEKCLAFRPEKRTNATQLLKEIEDILPRAVARLTSPESADFPFDREWKVYSSEADLNDMRPGNVNLERDEVFWWRLVIAYQCVDTSSEMLRPDLKASNIPKQARDLFASGRRDAKNESLLGPNSFRR
jgi:hypothetical protein